MLAAFIILFGMMTLAQTPPPPPVMPSQNPNEVAAPQPVNPSAPALPSTPAVAPTIPALAPAAAQPLLAPLPPNLAGAKPTDKKKVDQASDRVKSPFMLPKEIFLRLIKKKVDVQSEGVIDYGIVATRRWPLKYYRLVAVIWSVKNPKAMISDKDGKMHLYKEKDYIGNLEGFITEINNGEVVVLERGSEIRLKLSK